MDKWKNYRRDPRNYFGRQLIMQAGLSKINLSSVPGVTLSDDNRLHVVLLSPQEFRNRLHPEAYLPYGCGV